MIVVTGATGVLGTALMSALFERSKKATGLSRSDVDLLDYDSTVRLFDDLRPTLVYHAAGRVHGIMGNSQFPAEMYLDNLRINTNVIEAARLAGCQRIIAVSTVAAYPGDLALPMHEDDIWNGPPHGTEQFYAHSKRAMLAHLESCRRQYGLEYAYALMTNIYGPNDRFDVENGHVVPSLIAKFHEAKRTGKPISVWGSGIAKRDFVYSADAAQSLIAIAERGSGVINVASGTTIPIRGLVEILQEVSGVDDVRWDKSRPDGQLDRSYDTSRLLALGVKPFRTLREGLEATYRWYGDHYPDVRT